MNWARTTCRLLAAAAALAAVAACPRQPQVSSFEPPPEKRGDLGLEPADSSGLSPVAFLDESFVVTSRELLYSAEGRMVKYAGYYGSPGRVLFLSVPFDLERTEERAGPLYLVNAEDISEIFQLKDADLVLDVKSAAFGGFIYHKLTEQAPVAEGDQKSLVPHDPSAEYSLQAHLLQLDGTDVPLLEDNMIVADSFADGRLLAGRIVGVTPFHGHFGIGQPRGWALFSPRGEAEVEFDYKPLLSPDCKVALDVVRHYDAEDYSTSVFALYSGEPGASVSALTLLYSCPYFITLEEQRWNPVAVFIGPSTLLVSRFVPVSTGSTAVPNTSGHLTLDRLETDTRAASVLMQVASPHFSVLAPVNSPVFLWLSRGGPEQQFTYSLGATAVDGSKQRVLARGLSGQALQLAGIDFASGRLLLIEQNATGGGYSVIREFMLAESPPAPPGGEEQEESPGVEEEPAEAASGPPPITVPLKGA